MHIKNCKELYSIYKYILVHVRKYYSTKLIVNYKFKSTTEDCL